MMPLDDLMRPRARALSAIALLGAIFVMMVAGAISSPRAQGASLRSRYARSVQARSLPAHAAPGAMLPAHVTTGDHC